MKNLLTALVTLLFVVGLSAFAQGTIYFSNLRDGGPNAPVYQTDGVTKLSGPQFMAELLEGPTAGSLTGVAATSFLGGNGAGYFDGGIITLQGVSVTATVWVQVDVWNTASGASFLQAQTSGLPNSWWQSSAFTVITGGITFPAAELRDLGTSPVFLNNAVPEPSPLALCMLAGVLAIIRLWMSAVGQKGPGRVENGPF